jgi:hypothetical protein
MRAQLFCVERPLTATFLQKTASLRGASTYGSVRAKTALLRKASTEATEKEKKT